MNKGVLSYERAMRLWDVFSAHGDLGPLLAAMAIRESDANPSAKQLNGGGRGLMQIDVTQTPGKRYKDDPRLMTAEGNVEIMNAERENLARYGFSGANANMLYMLLHIYNAGYFNRETMKRLAKSSNPRDFDKGTTNGNYVSSIINFAKHCFGMQGV